MYVVNPLKNLGFIPYHQYVSRVSVLHPLLHSSSSHTNFQERGGRRGTQNNLIKSISILDKLPVPYISHCLFPNSHCVRLCLCAYHCVFVSAAALSSIH